MNLRDYKTVADRRTALEKETGVLLPNIGHFSFDEKVASSHNCENMIGVAQVPMGIAGPLKTCHVSRVTCHDYYIPLATTEGALVASVNRGCKAITESVGVVVASERVGATRGPVFETSGIGQSVLLKRWLDERFEQLAQEARKTSNHLRMIKLGARVAGKRVYMRFYFDTQDAMGMNMATIATEAIVRHIEKKTGARCVSLAGNFDVDKKPAWLNIVSGRGYRAWAEVTLPLSVLRSVLKTSASKTYDVWLAKCMIGSAMAGSMGYNAHVANIIAALFLATGQDLGHVGECSVGITTCEITHNESLYVSVYLPDLMVGTVGGGTGLGTQKEALSILGVAGGDNGKNAQRFAEIIAAAALAGEISLLASLSEGTLAKAHEKLARGKRINE